MRTITIATTILGIIFGGFGHGGEHHYKYTCDRIEGDYAVIEVYDECCDTITMVDVKLQK